MRIVFLGNHDVGIKSLQALVASGANVMGIVAHPEDPEEKVVFGSVFDYGVSLKIPTIRATGKSDALKEFIKQLRPDLLWVTDYRYLIPDDVIQSVPSGAVNLHPSLLPKYRGRAVLNWALIHDEKEVGLTAHYIDKEVDNGDIIAQEKINVGNNDTIKDVLDNLMPVYQSMTENVFRQFLNNTVARHPQDHSKASVFPKRTPQDGQINWQWNSVKVHNFIRALTAPYPGAYTFLNGSKVMIWHSQPFSLSGVPGQILEVGHDYFVVACGEHSISCFQATDQSGHSFEAMVGKRFD